MVPETLHIELCPWVEDLIYPIARYGRSLRVRKASDFEVIEFHAKAGGGELDSLEKSQIGDLPFLFSKGHGILLKHPVDVGVITLEDVKIETGTAKEILDGVAGRPSF